MFRKRVVSWIIDYGIILGLFYSYGFIAVFLQDRLNEEILDKTVYPMTIVVLIVFYVALILKDVIHKKSLGKKIMHLKIEDKDGYEPSIFQLIVRNLYFFMWPIEVGLLLADKERLGDKKAGTRVVEEGTKGDGVK